MLSFWNWIRERSRQAVLAGVADAVQDLDGNGPADTADAVALLEARLQPALPAPLDADNGLAEASKSRSRKRADAQRRGHQPELSGARVEHELCD